MKRIGTDELLLALALLLVSTPLQLVSARTAAPVPKPVFVPGLYETESRNSAFKDQRIKRRTCIASADFEAFKREMIAQYLEEPQFKKVCKLSDPKPDADGFALAMDCGHAKSIIEFHFAEGLVGSSTRTRITSRPEYSSTIRTLSRRIGDCKRSTDEAL